jgi:Flp pilus assembly protein TadG
MAHYFGSRKGTAALEVGLMLPWLVFSFIGVLDFGFSAYSLIATQNAARAGAMWGAASSANASSPTFQATACSYAADALKYAPTPVTGCAAPLSVTALTSTQGSLPAVQVSVTYTLKLLAIPAMMPGSLQITRTAWLPVRN